MQELIQKWREFMAETRKHHQDAEMRLGFPMAFSKPTFYDFMEWLSK